MCCDGLGLRFGFYRVDDSNCFHRRLNVMDADDVRPFQDRGGDGCQGRVQTFIRGRGGAIFVGEDAAEERLSRSANQKREVGKGGDELI